MEPPKHHALTSRQLNTLHSWRVEHGQSVRQMTVRNFSTKDKPGTLPLNVYLLEEPTPHPLDLSKTSRQTDETDNSHDQLKDLSVVTNVSPVDILQPRKPIIACVRAGFQPSEARPSPFYLACLQAPLNDSIQLISAQWFSQDISHPLRFLEDLRAPLQVKAISCCVDAYSLCTDTVCLEEIVYQELLQTTRDGGDMLTNQEQYNQDDQEFIDTVHSHTNNDEHTFTRTTTRSGRTSKKRDDWDYVYF